MATHGKRPDLLLYRKAWLEGQDNETAKKIAQELEFTADEDCDPLIAPAILGIECETSMWNVRLMVAKGKSPTVVVKDVDLPELKSWADHFGKPVHFVQLFQDQAYYLSLADLLARVNDGRAVPEKQYRVPFKAFYIRPPAARLAGDLDPEAKIRARYSVGTDGRIRSHLEFHNARLVLAAEWLMALEEAAG